jgi:hypothetical protein
LSSWNQWKERSDELAGWVADYPIPEIFHGLFIKDTDSILNLPAGYTPSRQAVTESKSIEIIPCFNHIKFQKTVSLFLPIGT